MFSGDAINFIIEGDYSGDSFCSQITPYLFENFTESQCQSVYNGTFKKGLKQTTFMILYQLSQLQIKFEKAQSVQDLQNILKDPIIIEYNIASNSFLRAAFTGLLDTCKSSMDSYYSKIKLFLQVKFSLFIIFTFLILTVLWRLFLRNIQAEIYRSKGMLNMIPTAFLAQEKNLKSLALSHLIDSY